MSKIISKTLTIDLVDTTGLTGFNVYYGLKSKGDLTYDSTFVFFPVVAGQLEYIITLPGSFTITEAEYNFGVAPVDEAGNIADVIGTSYLFDFTPPQPAKSIKIS
jgi:hypothetical protein